MLVINNKVKREVKRIMKEEIKRRNPNRLKDSVEGVLLHNYISDFGYGFADHKILMAAETQEQALERLSRYLPVYGQELVYSAYDCTGEPFNEPAEVKQVAPGRFFIKLYIRFDV